MGAAGWRSPRAPVAGRIGVALGSRVIISSEPGSTAAAGLLGPGCTGPPRDDLATLVLERSGIVAVVTDLDLTVAWASFGTSGRPPFVTRDRLVGAPLPAVVSPSMSRRVEQLHRSVTAGAAAGASAPIASSTDAPNGGWRIDVRWAHDHDERGPERALLWTFVPVAVDSLQAAMIEQRLEAIENVCRMIAARVRATEVALAAAADDPGHRAKAPFREPLGLRETEILSLLLYGLRVPTIARHLFLGQSTVRTHLASLLRKAGVRSRRALLERIAAHDAEPARAPQMGSSARERSPGGEGG